MKDQSATESDTGRSQTWSGEEMTVNGSKEEVEDDKFTKCGLCGEMFTEPKMLSCLHTFCLRCLEDFNATTTPQSHSAALTRKVTCPCCREEYPLPAGGLGQLPVNMFFARLAERRRTLSSVGEVDVGSQEVKSLLLAAF